MNTMVRRLALIALCTWVSIVACGCSSPARPKPKPADAELARRFDAAYAAYGQGRLDQAARLFARAADRADLRDDLPAAAEAHYSTALCLTRLRRHADAAAALDRAEFATALDGDPIPHDVTLLRAWIAYRTGAYDRAMEAANAVIDTPGARRGWVTDAYAVIGRVAIERKEIGEARAAVASMGAPTDPRGRAEVARLEAMIARLEGNHVDAAAAFDREVELRRTARDYFDMAHALADAAAAYRAQDDAAAACERYLRAGRSATQQELYPDAGDWLSLAATLSANVADPRMSAAVAEARARLAEAKQDAPGR